MPRHCEKPDAATLGAADETKLYDRNPLEHERLLFGAITFLIPAVVRP
jgi:hypothetical protein